MPQPIQTSAPHPRLTARGWLIVFLGVHAAPVLVWLIIVASNGIPSRQEAVLFSAVLVAFCLIGVGAAFLGLRTLPRLGRGQAVTYALVAGASWAMALSLSARAVVFTKDHGWRFPLAGLDYFAWKDFFHYVPTFAALMALGTIPLLLALSWVAPSRLRAIATLPVRPLEISRRAFGISMAVILLGLGAAGALGFLGRPPRSSLAMHDSTRLVARVSEGPIDPSVRDVSLALPQGFTMVREDMADFVLIHVQDDHGAPFLGLYIGGWPQWPPRVSPFSRRTLTQAHGLKVDAVFFWSLKGYERQAWIVPEIGLEGWGVHAWYQGLNRHQAALADRILDTIWLQRWGVKEKVARPIAYRAIDPAYKAFPCRLANPLCPG